MATLKQLRHYFQSLSLTTLPIGYVCHSQYIFRFLVSSSFLPRFFLVLLLILTLLYSDMWDGEIKRRKFFENYARANDFDPLAADSWYAQPKDKIMSYKV